MSLIRRVINRAASAMPANGAWRLDHAPLCTFTFDDCPRSSMTVAGRLLEEAGAAGTYFVSGSMANAPPAKDMLRLDDLRSLQARGHEIGSHTFAHVPATRQSTQQLKEDLALNEQTLRGACDIESLASFAYPLGEVTFGAKRLVASQFAAARGIRGGLNHRFIDLAELRAVSIYHNTYSLQKCRDLIAACKRQSAWLIFYTHDVRDNPSKWGCTEGEFAAVLDAVVESGIEIMTMRSAVGRMMFRRPAPA